MDSGPPAALVSRKRSRDKATGSTERAAPQISSGAAGDGRRGVLVAPVPPRRSQEDVNEGLDAPLLAFLERHGDGFSLSEALDARKQEVRQRLDLLGGGRRTRVTSSWDAERRETHWDFLLKEMLWMADDFGQERKRHLARAKKLSRAVETHFRQAAAREARAEREAQQRLRRSAARLGRHVKLFWGKITKVVAYKQKLSLDEQRKSSMDKHLNFIVAQTERYTFQLVQDFNHGTDTDGGRSGTETEGGYASLDGKGRLGRAPLSNGDPDDDADAAFELDEDPGDDETTIAKAEREQMAQGAYEPGSEVSQLQQEGERPIEELLREYAAMEAAERTRAPDPAEAMFGGEEEGGAESDEYEASEEESDDEVTIALAEGEVGRDTVAAEMMGLEEDGHVPIEELRARYRAVEDYGSGSGSSTDSGSSGNGGSDGAADGSGTQARGGRRRSKGATGELEGHGTSADPAPRPDVDAGRARPPEDAAVSATGRASHRRGARRSARVNGNAPAPTEDASGSDEDFRFTDEVDDETTIAQEDSGMNAAASRAEVQELEAAQEQPLEELLELYKRMHEEEENGDAAQGHESDESDDAVESEDAEESGSISRRNGRRRGPPPQVPGAASQPVRSRLRRRAAPRFGAEEAQAPAREGAGPVAATATEDQADSGEDEFEASEAEADDETSIAVAEAAGAQDAAQEIGALQGDAEQPLEELLELQRRMNAELDAEGSPDDPLDTSEAMDEGGADPRGKGDCPRKVPDEEPQPGPGNTGASADEASGDDAMSLEDSTPAGETPANETPADEAQTSDAMVERLQRLDDEVKSKRVERSYLLTKTLRLREYQEVGVSWLVSLHERRLNGILADEMGLGKTIQTISLLAWLACFRGVWGPHLIVVPTSCIVNWESELKRFCPGLKVLTYYGSAATRKQLRTGWSKLNAFHVCITSYQLAVKDASSFRRKKWYYLILDEAHNIKNFQSQRWTTLVSFSTQRRLLLTGTPLQNSLMELWALLHFLMPHIFSNRAEFSYWFSNPLTAMVENQTDVNRGLIRRLHAIMRPFLLRRLKKDVAKQLPRKVEHVVYCALSRRQQQLYEEFLSRSATRAALSGGNFMGMMNVLMQLRKVCNHPDLFEPRPIRGPFVMEPVLAAYPKLVRHAAEPGIFSGLSSSQARVLNASVRSQQLRLPLDLTPSGAHRRRLEAENAGAMHAFVQLEDVALAPAEAHLLARNPALRQRFEARMGARAAEERRRRCELFFVNRARDTPPLQRQLEVLARVAGGVYETLSMLVGRASRDARLRGSVAPALMALVRQPVERLQTVFHLVPHFAFVTPQVTARTPLLVGAPPLDARVPRMRGECTALAEPFYPVHQRLRLHFPDRKLVQFDCGKLQTLARLLRQRWLGGHKCLIFTQMSKMLNILEEFLNLYNYSYLRLDGSTGVDQRQKLMDRFNSDEKIFCFILSTRSGGLGINLTGADTVIFYDSDWNPAMDAQAQDRAHRIGQTREVHIYRLVSRSTIEENILKKAKQKQQLDLLVMEEGDFGANFYTGDNLRGLLSDGVYASNAETRAATGADRGGDDAAADVSDAAGTLGASAAPAPPKDLKAMMTQLEDEDDATALAKTTKELEEETREFDDQAPETEESRKSEAGTPRAVSPALSPKGAGNAEAAWGAEDDADARRQEDMQNAAFASWQARVGTSLQRIDASLSAIDRFAVGFKTGPDPFYSAHFRSDEQRLAELTAANANRWDIHEWEEAKAAEEHAALSSGELIYTAVSKRAARSLHRRYDGERRRRAAARKLRRLKGDDWQPQTDGRTQLPFWLNVDTGEATWYQPEVVRQREELAEAARRRYDATPPLVLRMIFECLMPFPDRSRAALVCFQWLAASRSDKLWLRALPVENQPPPALSDAEGPGQGASSLLEPPPAKSRSQPYLTLSAALDAAHHGDTILLDGGHYWEDDITLEKRVRLVGSRVSRTVLELGGLIRVTAAGANLCHLTIRRPKRRPDAPNLVVVEATAPKGRALLRLLDCQVDATGTSGAGVCVGRGGQVEVQGATLRDAGGSGLFVGARGAGYVLRSRVLNCGHAGLAVNGGMLLAEDTVLRGNGAEGVTALGGGLALVRHCEVAENAEKRKRGRPGPGTVVEDDGPTSRKRIRLVMGSEFLDAAEKDGLKENLEVTENWVPGAAADPWDRAFFADEGSELRQGHNVLN